MVFQETDEPPAAPKYDTPIVGAVAKTKDKSASDLAVELRSLGHQQLAFGNAAAIKANAGRMGICLTRTVAPFTLGYVGKPKGLKQIAFERSFWTREEIRIKRGGVKSEELRLKIGTCTDFIKEISQLQHMAEELGVEVRMTPKAHPELAGRGIEYIWGYAKLVFRKENTSCDKEKTTKLWEHIESALGKLDVQRVRKYRC